MQLLCIKNKSNVCNIEEIERIAKKYDLKVIYDAAHTFGETYKGKGIGSFGDASCFSFHATKVFNTIEGGAVCYRNRELGERLYNLKNFGIRGPEVVESVGANAKMNEFCAAMGICNLRHIDKEIAKRKKVVERYRVRLESVEGLQLNPIQEGVTSNYAYFPVVFDEKVFGFFHGQFDANDTPVALHISKRVLTLPLYADLNLEDVDKICDIILQ